jgi:uncharacterized protein YyaL (SSP411 family)
MTRGDRLGHSWRDGRLLFPGLASDFACMIKAALASHEATGERRYLEQALTWQPRSTATTPIRTMAAISSPRTMPKAWWCARPRTHDDATPNPKPIAAANLVRLAVLAGDDAWREKADRLIEGVLGARGREPDRPCGAAQRARPAAARRRDRHHRIRRARGRADRCGTKTLVPRPHRAARARRRRPARLASGA